MEIIYSCQAPEAQRFQQPAAYSVLGREDYPIPWDHNAEIYWHIHNWSQDMEPYHQVGIIDKAFGEWERRMFPTRTLSTADPTKAKIHIYNSMDNVIKLPNGDSMDSPYDFKIAPGVIAVAYAFSGSKYDGWVVVNDDHQFAISKQGHGFDLFSVLSHEFGHLWKIGHSKVLKSIMGPTYSKDAMFTEDEDNAIDYIHGDQLRGFVKTVPQAKRFIKHYVQTVGEPERPKGCNVLKAVKGLLKP